ncbi:MAG: phage major capsid protein [Pseudomonadales bacterium]|nr:phage major capsid protein [Pseudomonadales bacterium]
MDILAKPARPRGLIGGPRADLTPKAIHAQLMKTFEEFKDGVDEELKGVKAKFDDVVTKDKVEKINAQVSSLEKALEDANAMIAAAQAGGVGGEDQDEFAAERREHAKAFEKFFRRGAEADLAALQVKAQLSTDDDASGGYVVPREMEGTIDQIARNFSVMRQLASVRTIGTDTYSKLVNMGTAGSGWVGENEDRTETTTPTLREIVVNVHEIYAFPFTTQKMLDDGIIDVAQWLGDEVSIAFDEQEAETFISGDGVKKPRGLWDYDKVENDSWEWGKFGFVISGKSDGFLAPTTSVSPADCLFDLIYALRPQFRANGRFLMNDKTALTVRKFKDNDGNFLWREPTMPEDVPTMCGKPVSTDDYVPLVEANSFPIAFGDIARTYTIFDRIGIRILRDNITQKGRVGFYTTKRVGAGATHFQPLKFLKIAAS